MQKLSGKLKNTPSDAPQVRRSVSSELNGEETLSVQDKVLPDNSSDVDRQSGKTERNLRVCVLNMRGEALMPTKPAKARHLLDDEKAEVVKRKPFTIQLKYPTGENKQDITLGVDAGYSHVGFSAVTNKKELISGELELRNDISKKLEQRANYRKTRRSRKWYREPRFDNRKREDGWLAPSIQHKLDTHIRLVNQLKEILPIDRVVVEVANFDTQKMENPEISGKEYQHGTLEGYNIKNYLLEKFDHRCVYCGKKNVPLETEHVIPKSRGGTDRVSNLTISCHKCNQKKGSKTAEEFGHPEIQKQCKKPLKAAAFMNIVRWKMVDKLDCYRTYGSVTKKNRIDLDLDKTHVNDAFVIAGGTDQERCVPYKVTQRRRNNRKLQINRKTYGISVRKQRYDIQPGDLVEYSGDIVRSKGCHCYGKRVMLEDIGSKNIKDVKLVKYGKGLTFKEVKSGNSSST